MVKTTECDAIKLFLDIEFASFRNYLNNKDLGISCFIKALKIGCSYKLPFFYYSFVLTTPTSEPNKNKT